MILCDTGVIVAAIRSADSLHDRALRAMSNLTAPVVTTWPCLTEAMPLLSRAGSASVEVPYRQIEREVFHLPPPTIEDARRACVLMRRYSDIPMDFADAPLVVAAEALNTSRILTFDRHFFAYRVNNTEAFDIGP